MKHILEKKVYDNYIDIDSVEFQEIVETVKEIFYYLTDDGFKIRFYSKTMGFNFITIIEIVKKWKRFKWKNVKNHIKSCITFLGDVYDSTIIEYKDYDRGDIKIQHSNGDKLSDLDDTLEDVGIYNITIRLRTYSKDVMRRTIYHFLTESISPDPNYLKAKDYVENNKYFLKNLWIESLSEQENEENLIGYFMQYPDEMKSKINDDNIRLPMYNAYLNNYAPNIQRSIGTTNGLTID